MIDVTESATGNVTAAAIKTPRKTDGSKFLTPRQISDRWGWHVESVRRALRQRRLASVINSRRRLVTLVEIERHEAAGLIERVV